MGDGTEGPYSARTEAEGQTGEAVVRLMPAEKHKRYGWPEQLHERPGRASMAELWRARMQVNVMISEGRQDGEPIQMLVLPYGPQATIPSHVRHLQWRCLATAEAGDQIIGLPPGAVEAALAATGYVLTMPKAPRLALCR